MASFNTSQVHNNVIDIQDSNLSSHVDNVIQNDNTDRGSIDIENVGLNESAGTKDVLYAMRERAQRLHSQVYVFIVPLKFF